MGLLAGRLVVPAHSPHDEGTRGRETGVNKKSIKSDLARIDRMRDADIDCSDIPPIDKTLLKKATTAWPQ